MTDERQSWCAQCAKELGLKEDIWVDDPLKTRYQRDKHEKHTGEPSAQFPVQSIFDTDTTGYLKKAIDETIEHGFVIDDPAKGRSIGFVPSTSSRIGMKYYAGILGEETDSVVLVNTTKPGKEHPLTEKSDVFRDMRCVKCGGPLFS